jgi:hypothetical protein
MTPSGIEPVTFQFVAQHLNHCATAVPWSFMYITKNKGTEINPWGTYILLSPNLIKHFAFHYIILLRVFDLYLLGRT